MFVKAMRDIKKLAMIGSGVILIASISLSFTQASYLLDYLLITATILTGVPITYYAIQVLRYKVISIELLVAIAMIGALYIGEYVESAVVGFLFLFGGFLESLTLSRTRKAIQSLLDIKPEDANVLVDGKEKKVPIEEVKVGDTVVIKTGGKVPVDGIITSGMARLNEAMMTGESIPVKKSSDDEVFSGTMIEDGYLQVRTTKVGEATAFGQIIEMVEEAQDQKSKAERFLNTFSQYYTPSVVVLAIIVYFITSNLHLAITFLVIACPGALVIGAPVSNVSGIGNGAKHGLLMKGGDVIDRFNKARTFVFDKTGTLTKGKAEVIALHSVTDSKEWFGEVAEIESQSEHHLAKAIVKKAQESGPVKTGSHKIKAIKGQGLTASYKDQTYLIGNRRLLNDNGTRISEALYTQVNAYEEKGATVIFVARNQEVLGLIAIADELRLEAKASLIQLRKHGAKRIIMLTGDHHTTAQVIAKELGITEVYSEHSPKEKLEVIKSFQAAGEQVVMVGDGVNDAPALALSDVGVAMGLSGTDVAIETADVVVMNDRLDQLVNAFKISKQTVKNRNQNLTIALVTVLLLLMGVLNGKINLASGMFIHEASVMLVILNGMRLLKYKPKG